MSAFAVCFQRDGTPVSRSVLEAMLEAQASLGPDAVDARVEGVVGMGYRALWTTAEERSATQPLSLPGLPFMVAWSGRIDNREELCRRLRASPHDARAWSDAELFLRLYADEGTRVFTSMVGAFALALYDRMSRTVLLARDPIGHRDLTFHLSQKTLIAATAESGVLAHPSVDKRLDPVQLAVIMGYTGMSRDETFFDGVHKLLPGHYMEVSAKRTNIFRYWAPDTARRIYYRDSREYAEHYRELLDNAVSCRMRSEGPIGVMTSGGLDSGPVAAIAALKSPGKPVYSLSWVFQRYPQCDERQYLRPLWDKYRLTPVEIDCDDAEPFHDFEHWPVHPDTPDQDPYRRFLDNTYAAARDNGVRVILNGGGGDNLYLSGDRWFWELLRAGDFRRAWSGMRWHTAQSGYRKFARNILLRSAIPYRVLKKLRPNQLPEWLTADASDLLKDRCRWPPEYTRARRPAQCLNALSLRASDFSNAESYWSGQYRVEVRYPLRDRRIIEYMLQVPDHQLRFNQTMRPILRAAVADLLPEPQLNRLDKANFSPLFQHGAQAAAALIARYLDDPENLWSRFLRKDWVTGNAAPTQDVADALKWIAVSVELWRVSEGLSL